MYRTPTYLCIRIRTFRKVWNSMCVRCTNCTRCMRFFGKRISRKISSNFWTQILCIVLNVHRIWKTSNACFTWSSNRSNQRTYVYYAVLPATAKHILLFITFYAKRIRNNIFYSFRLQRKLNLGETICILASDKNTILPRYKWDEISVRARFVVQRL